jgi:hypothetical protein
MEKVSRLLLLQPDAVLEIAPGVPGAPVTVTARVDAAELPHELLATTVTLPPAAPDVAIILVVADVPVHPFGRVHV